MRDRWATLRAAISSPADVLLALRMAAWTPVLPLLKRLVALPRLVRIVSVRPSSGPRAPDRERRIARVGRLLYRSRTVSVRDNCLERSLILYRFLSRAGAGPELVVGVGKDDVSAVRGHVWVVVDGAALYETDEDLAEFVPVLTFQAGEMTSAGSPAGALPRTKGGADAQEEPDRPPQIRRGQSYGAATGDRRPRPHEGD
jgi:hypothetical protein